VVGYQRFRGQYCLHLLSSIKTVKSISGKTGCRRVEQKWYTTSLAIHPKGHIQ